VVAGFSPVAVKQAVELVRRVRQRGVTLFIIDHFLTLSLRVSDRLLALDHGEKVAEGIPQEVMRNREVISAYLGMRHEDE
jgi:branched-chain amino acid transport system ATP-binding protein